MPRSLGGKQFSQENHIDLQTVELDVLSEERSIAVRGALNAATVQALREDVMKGSNRALEQHRRPSLRNELCWQRPI